MAESGTEGVIGEVSGGNPLSRVDRYVHSAGNRAPDKKLPVGGSIRIPTGPFASMLYTHEGDRHETTNRDVWSYRSAAFGDQFETIYPNPNSPDGTGRALVRQRARGALEGGEGAAFAPGKTVLFPGSGQAIGLLQYSKLYPEAVFIGVDRGYAETRALDITKPGVQLTHGDWNSLANVPRNSVDTIVSVQDALWWGVRESDMETSLAVVGALTRVAKEGAVMRFDVQPGARDTLHAKRLLLTSGWKVDFVDGTAIAVKQRATPSSTRSMSHVRR